MRKNKNNKWDDIHDLEKHEIDELWEMTASYKSDFEPNLEDAFTRFQQMTEAQEAAPKVRRLSRYTVLRVAATLLFLLGAVAVWKYAFSDKNNEMKLAAADQIEEVLLADGTLVTLNKGAVLTYPENFKGSQRVVNLKGEAFFTVAKNAHKPFIIYAKNTKVRVVGTVFNVRANPEENFVEVAVKEGKVEFGTKDNDAKLTLTPNERGTYFEDKNQLKEELSGSTEWAWNGDRLYFKNANIIEIKHNLERVLGVQIILEGAFNGCTLTANLGKERSIQKILDAIEGNMNVTIKQNEISNSYTITGRCK